ncbi:S8 family serine peptidase [Colwellia sp. D2M02]|uniref:S8 family serine peptidase n=1 Tax=Colwellia sp. D2M02 TaxID=2841562 RepID=UPI001C089A9E|nr:S8 family serine peptidase [Colwellia sp. D2M02]MBU2892881.1 S8 family serine peptidase [Colwellia sp. D2M02]
MQLKKSIIGSVITLTLATSSYANEVSVDRSQLILTGGNLDQTVQPTKTISYIVQLKGQSAIERAQAIGELLPSNQQVAVAGNNYNANTPAMRAYHLALEAKQKSVAQGIGSIDINYSFKHTFNGFSAVLTPSQKASLESHPDVIGIWEDKVQHVSTANTPEFLGLTSEAGQHTLDIKGEDIIIGIIDTGIWPENPSFSDDGSYSDPSTLGWLGACDSGLDEAFSCNNKLIGARFFKDSFENTYEIQYELGEIDSPRDAAGHGSHTAGTAAGNEAVASTVNIDGYAADAGLISGMAPRARIAAYKACWNDSYKDPITGDSQAGCMYGDTMAAIDQAVADGVDVINYSIGGSRTDLTTPPTAAMLRASDAGVFVAVSAGNSGRDGAETIGTPAPWITTVGASTYSGEVPAQGLTYSSRTPQETVLAPEGAITKPLKDSGPIINNVVVAEPLLGCFEGETATALDNANQLAGNIALISRGGCPFSQKVERAQLSGATAVIVYSTDETPIIMGGEGAFDIPGMMISKSDGESLNTAITNGEVVEATLARGIFAPRTVTGNVMGDFSSLGPNTASYDIIKPDITAPGVRVLAAYSENPVSSASGDSFRYLQGTSMAAPHIAGIAALFKESNSTWSPAQIKSAMMTNAYQDVMKPDGVTPADPFNFGAGHVAPVASLNPGLLYDTNTADYLAFLCGIGNESYVASMGITCETLAEAGFNLDPSQLNLPSIGIAQLQAPETIIRTVSNASASASSYTATIEAPLGIDVQLQTFDANGAVNPNNTLDVAVNGTASYALTFTRTEATEFDTWKFGAITWTDNSGHSVRSPIAVKAAADVKIEVPAQVSAQLERGRYRFPVKYNYTGSTSIDYAGLVAPFGSSRTVAQDENAIFSFNEPGLGFHGFTIPEGTKVARFSLRAGLVDVEGADLDFYLYRCVKWSCSSVDSATSSDSNEDIILTNPIAANDGAVGDLYIAFVHGKDLKGAESTDYTMMGWVADQASSSTRIISSKKAIKDRYNYTTITTRGLTAGMIYMGAVTYYNAEGEAEGTTVIELGN